MKNTLRAAGLLSLTAAALLSQPRGRILLPTGQSLKPAGRQVRLDPFPMAAQLTPNKRHLLVLHGGASKPAVVVLDASTMAERSRVGFDDAWLGMAIHPGGRTVYVSGGSRNNVHELTLSEEGKLAASRVFEVTPAAERKATNFLGDLALSPDGRLIYVADVHSDAIKVINPQSGRVIENWKTGRRPYKILFHPDGKSFFVSGWADGVVMQHDSQSGAVINRVIAGPHAMDMVWRDRNTSDEENEGGVVKARIFVALGNANAVRAIGVDDNRQLRAVETISVSLYPDSPAGMTPSALALSDDQGTLYVTCSDANAVAAVNVSSARSRTMGFIPTGWYPLASRPLDDKRLAILNARPGSASVVETADAADLLAWTDEVRRNTPYVEEKRYLGHRGDSSVIPAHPTERSPIEHVVYIVKEGVTYDQVLGDIGKGNSDVSRAVFGRKVTPNHHKLATEFVLLDNFYANGETGADGRNWSTAGIAPAYVQRLWPNSHAGRRAGNDYDGGEAAAMPPAGHIWNNGLAKGRRVRNYGYFAANRPVGEVNDGNHIAAVRDPALLPHTFRGFRAFDLDYLDVDRAKAFVTDLGQLEGAKQFPNFTIIRLGNDQTSGKSAGKRTATAQMADNDAALGMIVEALTRSTFWPKMAIFVVEASTNGGPDHADSHRAPAFVISPYAKRGAVDSSFYNSASVLRTMELILGLSPMTMHDAGAPPMLEAFTPVADLKVFTAEKPGVPLDERNPGNTANAGDGR